MITVTPDIDLAPFVGKRVRIQKTVRGARYTFYGVFETLRHHPAPTTGGAPYAGGILIAEPRPDYGDYRGGATGFDLQYNGTTTIELAP